MSNSGIFNSIPQSVVSAAAVKQILDFIDSCVLCRGQDDERFIAYIYTKKGKIMDPSGIWNDVFFLYMYVSSMLVEYVFTIPGVSVFLSNRLCQDPHEKFFGQQRQRGRVNENPSTTEFLRNTQALRVISNTCSKIRGNCRGSSIISEDLLESGPLPKHARKSS